MLLNLLQYIKSVIRKQTSCSIRRITYHLVLLCFTFTGAVQSVQVLLQLVLFAFGLLSICPRASLRGALHLLGPFGMQTFTILSFVNQSVTFFILVYLSIYLMEMCRYFPQTQLPQHSCVGSGFAVLYCGEKYLFLILTFYSPGSCFDYHHHERGS